MAVEIDLDDHGLEALERGIEAIRQQAYVLGPVGYKLVRRAVQSERRLFIDSPWAPRKASTIDRYSRPLRSMADEQLHLAAGAGPLDRHGLLERTLTTEHAPGQRDSIASVTGGLNVTFGLHHQGPVSYGNFQARGDGARRARDPFRFDRLAHDEGTRDVIDHILERFGDD
ncbi:hypothetical protein [Patulibacter sp. SYSU D01012]|uniref:hypothetical protein n=1 Tax=Patulibacter sp. SYSU D01012 TaxID=2817381 RepID=UPI001B305A96|nr:hypothetical protein [Patulibacter sp. SYSU D01012]